MHKNEQAESEAHQVHEDWSDAALDAEPVIGRRGWLRLAWIGALIAVVALLIVVPPLVNVKRYQHRVAQAISDSIGRPVHFDEIHVHVLPLPGLTIQNFVVQEDPAFGTEPAMRANVVEARLRLASLWRRRIEVSHIELKGPSINLVRRADGRWNLQGVVTQAGYLQSAPTAQGRAGATPRFPYIEATDARINVKQGETKLPWSLLDARLALWLPEENEWRVRVNGRPLRTDTDVSDVGELEVEGSLGRGAQGVMNQPLALSAKWRSTPLGEAAKLFVGQDTGFRGDASAEVEVRGTPAQMRLTTDLHLHNLRRAEFVPHLPMSVNAHCEAESNGILHQLRHVRCAIPTAQSSSLFEGVFRSHDDRVVRAPDVLAIEADVPNVLDPRSAVVTADLANGRPEYFLNWLRVLSSRVPEDVSADGQVQMHAAWNAAGGPADWSFDASCLCNLRPAPKTPADQTASPPLWWMHFARQPAGTNTRPKGIAVKVARPLTNQVNAGAATAAPTPTTTDMAKYEAEPALLQGEISRTGYSLQYTSSDLARYAASLLPPLGDDLPRDVSGPVQSERFWQQSQAWTAAAPEPVAPLRRRHHR